jgi:ubiquinone/menaquinone biosynthesis C-methylase UbiE
MPDMRLPDIRVPDDMKRDEMPDLLRHWYLGTRARRYMARRRFFEVDVELQPELGGKVLDIGSAWGYNVMALGLLGAQPVGMDLVVDQFSAGKRIAGENGLDFRVLGADAAYLPFADSVFRAIAMVETIEHVFEKDRETVLGECYRVLEPGGRLVLSTPNYGSLVERIKRVVVTYPWMRRRLPAMCYPAEDMRRTDYHPYHYHRPWETPRITAALEGAGFRVTAQKCFLFVTKNTPDGAFPLASLLEKVLEKMPFVNRLAATLCVVADKPAQDPSGPR